MTDVSFDPRRTPARPDLAAWKLRSIVDARRYVRGHDRCVCVSCAPIFNDARRSGTMLTQALFGETFTVYDSARGMSWGQLATDDYVGWIDSSCLADPESPTHRIRVLGSHMYDRADLKSPVLTALPVNARLAIVETGQLWCRTSKGWVPTRHVEPVETIIEDWVDVAESLIGVPYLWGGRSGAGIDCSALVQLALSMGGARPPRDSDMQYHELGHALGDGQALQRGDLVFWQGHVGIMTSAGDVIHANAWHMAVAVEPLRTARERIAASFGPITGFRRI